MRKRRGGPRVDSLEKYGVPQDVWDSMTRYQRSAVRDRYNRRVDPEKIRARDREQWHKFHERNLRRQRSYYYRNHERVLEAARKKWAKLSSLNKVHSSPDEVYRAIIKAVPAGLPKHVKDDVVGAMLLAVLERKLLVRDVKKQAAEFLRSHNREYDHFKTRSLDVKVFDDSGETFVDRLSSQDAIWAD